MELIINTKREFDFYWHQIFVATNKSISVTPPSKLDKMSISLIKAHVSNIFKNENIEKNLFDKIKIDCEQCLLTDHDISWLSQKDERLINWIWSLILVNRCINSLFIFFDFNYKNKSILSSTFQQASAYTPQPVQIYPTYPQPTHSQSPPLPPLPLLPTQERSSFIDLFNQFNFNDKAYSTKEKHGIILKYFSMSLLNKGDKISLINRLRENWILIKNMEDFKWLDKNNDQQATWAINYFIEYCRKNNTQSHDMTSIEFENDYYKFIFLFDSWSVYPDTKKLFSQSIRKASSQKKHRDKQVGKKQCSFNLSDKSIQQLSLLSEMQGKPKNHILETLINMEYLTTVSSYKT